MDASMLVRPGPRRILRPPLPYVNCAGFAQAAPGVPKEVSNHRAMVGLSSSPEPRRLGRLAPEFDRDVASVGVNGKPPCTVRIPFTCQLPSSAFSTGFEMPKRRDF